MKIIDTEDGEIVAEITSTGSMTIEDALAIAGYEQVTDEDDDNCGLWWIMTHNMISAWNRRVPNSEMRINEGRVDR